MSKLLKKFKGSSSAGQGFQGSQQFTGRPPSTGGSNRGVKPGQVDRSNPLRRKVNVGAIRTPLGGTL